MNKTIVALWIFSCAVVQAAEPLEIQFQQLAFEVKTLKLELYRVHLQQIALTAAPLQQELQAAQARLTRLDAAEKAARERLAVAAQQSKEDQLTPEERREIQELETGSSGDPARIAAEREKLRRRESELTRQTQSHLQAWNNYSTAAAALEAEIRKSTPAPSAR